MSQRGGRTLWDELRKRASNKSRSASLTTPENLPLAGRQITLGGTPASVNSGRARARDSPARSIAAARTWHHGTHMIRLTAMVIVHTPGSSQANCTVECAYAVVLNASALVFALTFLGLPWAALQRILPPAQYVVKPYHPKNIPFPEETSGKCCGFLCLNRSSRESVLAEMPTTLARRSGSALTLGLGAPLIKWYRYSGIPDSRRPTTLALTSSRASRASRRQCSDCQDQC